FDDITLTAEVLDIVDQEQLKAAVGAPGESFVSAPVCFASRFHLGHRSLGGFKGRAWIRPAEVIGYRFANLSKIDRFDRKRVRDYLLKRNIPIVVSGSVSSGLCFSPPGRRVVVGPG